jgi:hypothetical protein
VSAFRSRREVLRFLSRQVLWVVSEELVEAGSVELGLQGGG